jgi:adenosylmethionine-8-amino-7-oxononanoate aminotransferase
VADAVMVAPPFIITDAEIDLLISTLRASLDAVYPG